MNARHKLNVAYVNGAVIAGAVVGLIAQSWLAFFGATAGLVGLAFCERNIRVKKATN